MSFQCNRNVVFIPLKAKVVVFGRPLRRNTTGRLEYQQCFAYQEVVGEHYLMLSVR